MDSEYVTQDQLSDYVTKDQHNGNIRELATELKGEILYRPAQVDVTVDLGLGTASAVIMLCLAFLCYLLVRVLRSEW